MNVQLVMLLCNIDTYYSTATQLFFWIIQALIVFPSFSGATVSIQETEISVTEGTDGQLCIVLENAADGLERDVSVTLTTIAGTASTSILGIIR